VGGFRGGERGHLAAGGQVDAAGGGVQGGEQNVPGYHVRLRQPVQEGGLPCSQDWKPDEVGASKTELESNSTVLSRHSRRHPMQSCKHDITGDLRREGTAIGCVKLSRIVADNGACRDICDHRASFSECICPPPPNNTKGRPNCWKYNIQSGKGVGWHHTCIGVATEREDGYGELRPLVSRLPPVPAQEMNSSGKNNNGHGWLGLSHDSPDILSPVMISSQKLPHRFRCFWVV